MDGVEADTQPCMVRTSSRLRQRDTGRRGNLQSHCSPDASKKAHRLPPTSSSAQSKCSQNGVSSNRLSRLVDAGSSAVDSGSIQAGCSVKAIHDIVSRFGDTKKKLVESIGFGGLLKFPPIKSTNRKFSAWLMGMVDVRNSCLELPDGSTLKFYSEDVALVFGIPSSGKKVNDAGQLDKEAKEKMKHQCWPLTGKDQQSIKAIEDLVNTDYPGPMTPDQEDAFKIAFVVFVVSTLFVPGAKHDYAHVDYWGALSNPSTIHEFDWAAYIHKRLLIAAAKYKADIETGSRSPNITGCYLFLQLFYLDNMDIPQWVMDHSTRPRISCFTYDIIRNMIAADTHDRHDARAACVYGKTKVRPREHSCYTWAQTSMDHPVDTYMEAADSFWDAVVSLTTILRVPLEAARPLYMAVAELNRPSETCNTCSTVDCIAILLKIIRPFAKGFNCNFELHPEPEDLQTLHGDMDIPENLCHYCTKSGCKCKKRTYGIGASTSAGSGLANMRSLHDMACAGNCAPKRTRFTTVRSAEEIMWGASQSRSEAVDFSVIKLFSRFYMLIQRIRQRNHLDLNTASAETEQWHIENPIEAVQVVGAARSPWELGGRWDYNSIDTDELPGAVGVFPPSGDFALHPMPRIVDCTPKYIEVMPGAARDQRIGLSELEMDMFDAIIRCFKQSDDDLYRTEGRLRWRHYFESDILAAVLAGCFDIENPCMRNQFIGTHLTYDICNCNMLFFPVILHERWCCFSWNLKENEIVVFDPSYMNITGFSRQSIYRRVAEMLKTTLSTIIPILIPGWDHDWNAATVLPFHWRCAGLPWLNRTGVLCAYFCRCFDGHQPLPDMEQAHIGRIAEKLFTEVSALHKGQLPTGSGKLQNPIVHA